MPVSLRYTPRLIDRRIDPLFRELPAIALTGPRACGKTTTASRFVSSIARLDTKAARTAFEADPDAALAAYPEPVLIDEWHLVPEVLGAIKRTVDSAGGSGRFLLTGSARGKLESPTWPGTGRIVELRMEGLTRREIEGDLEAASFLERLSTASLEAFPSRPDPPNLPDYIKYALRGGFPDVAVGMSETAAEAWLDGYVDQLLTRDLDLLDENRDPTKLRRYFEALCLNTAGIPEHRTLYESAQISNRTASAYDRLLTSLFVLRPLPAWSGNRLKRLTRAEKQLVVDASLVGSALSLSSDDVLRDGNLLGRVIETFAIAQIRAEVDALGTRLRMHHLRDRGGTHEIDLVVEVPGGGLVAVEIKATSSPTIEHAKQLRWFREQVGDRFLAGAVLHAGPLPHRLDESTFALPLYSLWT